MNHLEHLKALRDKARIQTQQAEAVLKHQGEISESLDKLIAALEERGEDETSVLDDGNLPGSGNLAAATAGVAAAISGTAGAEPVESIDEALDGMTDAITGRDGPPQLDAIPAPEPAAGEEPKRAVVESLGELIANLEERPFEEGSAASAAAASVETEGGEEETGLGIGAAIAGAAATAAGAVAVADKALGGGGPEEGGEEGASWVAEQPPIPPPIAEAESDRPPLEPIVWEVAESDPAGVDDTEGEASDSAPEQEGQEKDEGNYQFVKLGDDGEGQAAEDSSDSEDDSAEAPEVPEGEAEEDSGGLSIPVAGVAAAGAAAAAAGVASLVNKDDDEGEDESLVGRIKDSVSDARFKVGEAAEAAMDKVDEVEDKMIEKGRELLGMEESKPAVPPPVPVPVPAVSEPEVADNTSGTPDATEVVPAAAGPEIEAATSTNVFFDANSAYLKESELSKLSDLCEAVASNAEACAIKIQGLEDLASSNDFKELLASRRLLAVRKSLADNGLNDGQISVTEIKLSEEGRILEPPSITISPS